MKFKFHSRNIVTVTSITHIHYAIYRYKIPIAECQDIGFYAGDRERKRRFAVCNDNHYKRWG